MLGMGTGQRTQADAMRVPARDLGHLQCREHEQGDIGSDQTRVLRSKQGACSACSSTTIAACGVGKSESGWGQGALLHPAGGSAPLVLHAAGHEPCSSRNPTPVLTQLLVRGGSSPRGPQTAGSACCSVLLLLPCRRAVSPGRATPAR